MQRTYRIFSVLITMVMVMAFLAPTSVAAQATIVQGTITIQVASGEDPIPVSDARIWIGIENGNVWQATTNAQGFYSANLSSVLPSQARVIVYAFKTGYAKTLVGEIKISPGSTTTLDAVVPVYKCLTCPLYHGVRVSDYGLLWPEVEPAGFAPYWPSALDTNSSERWVQALDAVGGGGDPASIWLVGEIDTEPGVNNGKVWMQFPKPASLPAHNDMYFDTQGGVMDQKVLVQNICNKNPRTRFFLALESGERAGTKQGVLDAIDYVMTAFKDIPCVAGFAVDGEWYGTVTGDTDGDPITDDIAVTWEARLLSYGLKYQLVLKHFVTNKLPPTYRGNIAFLESSQGVSSELALLTEYDAWAEHFSPNDVMFQFGYGEDQSWWGNLAAPAYETLPQDITQSYSGTQYVGTFNQGIGLFWVDFTLQYVMPGIFDPNKGPDVTLWKSGKTYAAGDKVAVAYDARTFVCLQAHTAQEDWQPPDAPALWQAEGDTDWAPNTIYTAGGVVIYNGNKYTCLQGHTSQAGWEPPNTPALWQAVGGSGTGWAPNTSYAAGDVVTYGGNEYTCVQGHTSLVGWEPPNVPALWQLK